jgi:hypothetical protein
LTLLDDSKVQRELGMTRAQADFVAREFKAYAAQAQSMFPQDMSKSQVEREMPRLTALQDQVSARVLAQLTPAQIARFRQLVLQGEGIWAVLIPEVSAELKLTTSQERRIRACRSAFAKKVRTLRERRQKDIDAVPGPRYKNDKAQFEAYRKAVVAVIKQNYRTDKKTIAGWGRSAVRSATAILTAKQRAAWTRMQGPKFHPK